MNKRNNVFWFHHPLLLAPQFHLSNSPMMFFLGVVFYPALIIRILLAWVFSEKINDTYIVILSLKWTTDIWHAKRIFIVQGRPYLPTTFFVRPLILCYNIWYHSTIPLNIVYHATSSYNILCYTATSCNIF